MNCKLNMGRAAGWLYLSLIPLGVFGIIYVPSVLVDATDTLVTMDNILANESLFRMSILSAILAQLINILVVFALYSVLKPVNKTYALLMVVFLLLGVPIAMLNELNHYGIFLLLETAQSATTFTTTQLAQFVSLLLESHEAGVSIASVFWGLWLFPMGLLVYKSSYIPRFIGVLLMIGSFGYLADFFIFFLLPELDIVMSQFTFVGEIVFPLWLVIKGSKAEEIQNKENG